MISNIQRFSLHDGPGIRTTVFFKGCPLRCSWCANPETQHMKKEMMHKKERCIQCGQCAISCPNDAINLDNGTFSHESSLCTFCGSCVQACPNRLLQIQGETLSAEEIMNVVLRDRVFYESSGGGMTLSGGEPFMQPNLASELLQLAKKQDINTCVETCLHYPFERLENVLNHLDYVYFDLKHVDPAKHKKATGVEPSLILENIRLLRQLRPDAMTRIPVIPGFNDAASDIEIICKKLLQLDVKEVELMRYHNWATSKYHALGRSYDYENVAIYQNDAFDEIRACYHKYGIITK